MNERTGEGRPVALAVEATPVVNLAVMQYPPMDDAVQVYLRVTPKLAFALSAYLETEHGIVLLPVDAEGMRRAKRG